ncbi:MAG TPA: hypothetical protein VKA02_03375 [Candidatus Acidoferrum sp.]|nr:hypothetical protein [Candidatus Acidoferrum sp.]
MSMGFCEGKEIMGKELAENEIFRLRKQAELLLRAGDVEQYNCVLVVISSIQANNQQAVYGREETPNARGNDSGSQCG